MARRVGPKRNRTGESSRSGRVAPVGLRIVGGRYRGRKLSYGGDLRVRPMKDRTREAVFNLLGPAIRGMRVYDLFAGTGAMALEALSRGAAGAVLVERHIPTAKVIRENIATLGAADLCEVITADVFRRFANPPAAGEQPWLVFCCPPYDFFVDRRAETLHLVRAFWDAAPARSAIVVESDDRFDHRELPETGNTDIRQYPPAVVSILWRPGSETSTEPCS